MEREQTKVHVLMRDERKKEERSKLDQTNKAKQHSTPKAVNMTFYDSPNVFTTVK